MRVRPMWDALYRWFYPSVSGRNLPLALVHRIAEQKGLLCAGDLRLLDAQHADLLVYTVLKMLHGAEIQTLFLRAVCERADEHDAEDLVDLVQHVLNGIPPEQTVQAMKLIQLHRQGFELWDRLYEEAARHIGEGNADLVLVAYAPVVGLRCFARALARAGRAIYLVSDKLIADACADFCGYRISWRDGAVMVEVVPKNYVWPSRLVVLEDTIKQGTTMRAVSNFIRSSRRDVSIEEIVLARTQPRIH